MTDLKQLGQQAVAAKYELQKLTRKEKDYALTQIAQALVDHAGEILAANEKDIQTARENGMHEGMVDRLRLSVERMQGIAEGLKQIVSLEDPIGEILEETIHSKGMRIQKRRVPIGVIGIIYESRPNVTADAFGLCFKSGNAVILKGGSDAIHSNIAITNCIRQTLHTCGITEDAIQLIEATDRAVTAEFMKLKEYVDLLIPRGGAGLIRAVVENSTIPVIETGTGNCHVFVDESADIGMAVRIIVNAKTQRIGVCNACESLVVHKEIRAAFLPVLAKALDEYNVDIRGDELTKEILPDCTLATEEDYATEYLDYILSVKTARSVEEAILHINRYSTMHSEVIITEHSEHAEKFLNEIDSACVYVNVSSRFSDGFEFGLGAEIGISTQKIHARGPMGLRELTSYKYTVEGTGQVR